jgi:hypothetical protein
VLGVGFGFCSRSNRKPWKPNSHLSRVADRSTESARTGKSPTRPNNRTHSRKGISLPTPVPGTDRSPTRYTAFVPICSEAGEERRISASRFRGGGRRGKRRAVRRRLGAERPAAAAHRRRAEASRRRRIPASRPWPEGPATLRCVGVARPQPAAVRHIGSKAV